MGGRDGVASLPSSEASSPFRSPSPPPSAPGLDAVVSSLVELLMWPVTYSEAGSRLGIRWPRGVLLHGPPGCGKTTAVRVAVARSGASVVTLSAGSLLSSEVGASERNLRELFASAERLAQDDPKRPVAILAEDLDALAPSRGDRGGAASGVARRIVATLLTLLDGATAEQQKDRRSDVREETAGTVGEGAGVGKESGTLRAATTPSSSPSAPARVLIIATTADPSRLDPALRRAGRLEREVPVPAPGPEARLAILRARCEGLRLSEEARRALPSIAADRCAGFSGADLTAVAREALVLAFRREEASEEAGGRSGNEPGCESALATDDGSWDVRAKSGDGESEKGIVRGSTNVDGPLVTEGDLRAALKLVGPSLVRAEAATVPPLAWSAIGGLEETKAALRRALLWPLQKPEALARLGIPPAKGVLLYGPPGTGKTSLARAAATEAGVPCLCLSPAEAFSAYVGEGEALLRARFAAARRAAPAMLILDELDVLVGKREGSGKGPAGAASGASSDASNVESRLLTTFLTELDGLEPSSGLVVIATTNRPGSIDDAVLRPGRIDAVLYVPPPDLPGRRQILEVKCRDVPIDPDNVNLDELAAKTDRCTGAELDALVREAALAAIQEASPQVRAKHFELALDRVRPALSQEDLERSVIWKRRGSRRRV